MIIAALLTPENARIALPVALAVGYACYHWWRWRMMHPKIVIEELPEPTKEVRTVAKPAPTKEESGSAAQTARERPARSEQERPLQPSGMSGVSQHGESRWQARREQEMAEAQFDFEAADPHCHARAYHKACGGRPEYFVLLGKYAWRRGAMVETHFWISMAKFHGVEGLEGWLGEVRRRWIRARRPKEWGNVYDQFPFERGALAYSYLMVCCGFGAAVHRNSIAEMARLGNEDAQLMMEKSSHL